MAVCNMLLYSIKIATFTCYIATVVLLLCRYKWQRMCVIKMFAEHISLNFIENEIITSAKRLWMVIYAY